jgi:hypothetical protein
MSITPFPKDHSTPPRPEVATPSAGGAAALPQRRRPSTNPLGGASARTQAAPTNLGDVRRQRDRQRAQLMKAVDDHMERAESTQLSVSLLYVWVARSLGPASALRYIEQASEERFNQCGDPWVNEDLETSCLRTGLTHEDWVDARRRLRDEGLIEERRHYDLVHESIGVQLRFMPDAFCKAAAEVREEIRDQLRPSIERGTDVGAVGE